MRESSSSESPSHYLVDLTTRLASGLSELAEEERSKHIDFFLSRQMEDGGFRGRGERSELYYTAFALRGLLVLGCPEERPLQHAAEYLKSQLHARVGIIDLISLIMAGRLLEVRLGARLLPAEPNGWQQELEKLFRALRRPDGGYAKAAEGYASSTYQTFLVTLVYQLLDLPLPEPERLVDFVLGQQREDGGFVEISVMRRSGTNPTAAAVGTLRAVQFDLTSAPHTSFTERVSKFLIGNQTEEGGLRANTQIPIADLLSTYTGLQTLVDLGAAEMLSAPRALGGFVTSLEQVEGGFLSAAWDEVTDVEYTFYGVASRGLLLSQQIH